MIEQTHDSEKNNARSNILDILKALDQSENNDISHKKVNGSEFALSYLGVAKPMSLFELYSLEISGSR